MIIRSVYSPHSGTIENFLRELENFFNDSAVRGFRPSKKKGRLVPDTRQDTLFFYLNIYWDNKKFSDMKNIFLNVKICSGVLRKRKPYIIEISLIVFEKKNILLKTWRPAPGYPIIYFVILTFSD